MTTGARGRQLLDVPPEVKVSAPIRSEGSILVLHVMSSASGPVRFGEILTGTGLSTTSVARALNALEASGIVNADLPPGERKGRGVAYSLDRARLDEVFAGLYNYVTGSSTERPSTLPPRR